MNIHGARIERDIFLEYISSGIVTGTIFLEVKLKTVSSVLDEVEIIDFSAGVLKRLNAAVGPSLVITSDVNMQFHNSLFSTNFVAI